MFVKTHIVKWITFGFATGITLFPFVLVRKQAKLTRSLVQHEKIHLRQQAELLVIPFYLFYGAEYVFRLFQYGSHYRAYRNISFEREAFDRQNTPGYLSRRRKWNWIKYL